MILIAIGLCCSSNASAASGKGRGCDEILPTESGMRLRPVQHSRLMGPAVLITLGLLFLISNSSPYGLSVRGQFC